MPWVIGVKNIEEGKIQVIQNGKDIDPDDPRYDSEFHVVPCKEEGEFVSFGYHEFKVECPCHPKVNIVEAGRRVVIHTDKVN